MSTSAFDDPLMTPQMRARQIRYQDAIGKVLIELLANEKDRSTLAVINALFHHLVLAMRLLKQEDLLKDDGIDKVMKRFEAAIRAEVLK